MTIIKPVVRLLLLCLLGGASIAAQAAPTEGCALIKVGGIPVDFILFGLTLLGVALFHNATLYVALTRATKRLSLLHIEPLPEVLRAPSVG